MTCIPKSREEAPPRTLAAELTCFEAGLALLGMRRRKIGLREYPLNSFRNAP